jgi:hypothetical protein
VLAWIRSDKGWPHALYEKKEDTCVWVSIKSGTANESIDTPNNKHFEQVYRSDTLKSTTATERTFELIICLYQLAGDRYVDQGCD